VLREREFREGPLDRDDLGPQTLKRLFGALLRHLFQLFDGQPAHSSRHRHPFRKTGQETRTRSLLKGIKACQIRWNPIPILRLESDHPTTEPREHLPRFSPTTRRVFIGRLCYCHGRLDFLVLTPAIYWFTTENLGHPQGIQGMAVDGARAMARCGTASLPACWAPFLGTLRV
jgi:hypothetical protein